MRRLAPIALVLTLAGCVGSPVSDVLPGNDLIPPGPVIGIENLPVFAAPALIDPMRAGGEPVVAITPKGTILVAAHPGYTHWHPSPGAPTTPELVAPTQTQSYMWRSTDGGKTFTVLGALSALPTKDVNAGPRGIGQGVSDPDFAIDGEGRIYFTDLEALAAASVSWSDDDGATWLEGNNLATLIVDRQWLTAFGKTIYIRGNGASDVRKSEDGGATWTDTGNSGCGGDIIANPTNGTLYVRCDAQNVGVSVSTDGGVSWETFESDLSSSGPISPEVAIDAAGNLYLASDEKRDQIQYAYSKDGGETWNTTSLKPFFPELAKGTVLWPWASAGSDGRLSVTFYGSPTKNAFRGTGGDWFVYNAIIVNATGPNPVVFASKLTPTPFHKGPMCQGGTACQLTTATDDGSDRRLGDFFETSIAPDGYLHVVYSDTQGKPTDTISHVGYVRQTGGVKLVEGPVPKGFPTQG